MRRPIAVALACVAAVAAASAASCGERSHVTAEPGEVVRRRPVFLDAGGTMLPGARITYGSVGADGDPVEVTGVVVAPPGQPPPDGWPLLAWGHPTTGGADDCTVSSDAGLIALANTIVPLAVAGFVVAATDYEGLGTPGPHPYLNGPSEGRAMTDAVRAARHVVADAGIHWVAMGHSQGGHAALWTAEVGPDHAPELDLAGVVAIAPAVDLQTLTDPLHPGGARFLALMAAGWLGADPDLDPAEVLTPAGQQEVAAVERSCLVNVTDPNIVADAEAFGDYVAANEPGQDPTSVPILIQAGGADPLITPGMVDGAVERLCDQGDTVQLAPYATSDHLTVVPQGAMDAVNWLHDRLNGVPAVSTCPG